MEANGNTVYAIDPEKIKAFLLRMQQEDPGHRVFGSECHKFRLGPPLSEGRLRAFEQKHGISLPADYRRFLNEIGNDGVVRATVPIFPASAGAGPGYGLLSLGEPDCYVDLSAPFPLTESSETQTVPGIELWGDEDKPYPGVLEIAYRGCAYFVFLVVNGPAYGTVWEACLDPVIFDPTGQSFGEWYEAWMDNTIGRALPILAAERKIAHITEGMTKEQVIGICGGKWKQEPWIKTSTYLSFEHLRTTFQLDENDVVARIVRHHI